MQHILNLRIPTAWQSLNDEQLRFVFLLLAGDYTVSQMKTLCLLKWAKLKVLRKEAGVFIVEYEGQVYALSSLQVAEALQELTWLETIPGYPVRLSRIDGCEPVRADLQGVPFDDYLTLDNLYQGYLQTQRSDLLQEMARILYQSKSIRLKRSEEICIFYWFSAVKQMFARMFRHFMKSVDTGLETPRIPTYQELQDAMNAQIRALTGGDITKEESVLSMDCWRALTELNAKAKDYEEMKNSQRP